MLSRSTTHRPYEKPVSVLRHSDSRLRTRHLHQTAARAGNQTHHREHSARPPLALQDPLPRCTRGQETPLAHPLQAPALSQKQPHPKTLSNADPNHSSIISGVILHKTAQKRNREVVERVDSSQNRRDRAQHFGNCSYMLSRESSARKRTVIAPIRSRRVGTTRADQPE